MLCMKWGSREDNATATKSVFCVFKVSKKIDMDPPLLLDIIASMITKIEHTMDPLMQDTTNSVVTRVEMHVNESKLMDNILERKKQFGDSAAINLRELALKKYSQKSFPSLQRVKRLLKKERASNLKALSVTTDDFFIQPSRLLHFVSFENPAPTKTLPVYVEKRAELSQDRSPWFSSIMAEEIAAVIDAFNNNATRSKHPKPQGADAGLGLTKTDAAPPVTLKIRLKMNESTKSTNDNRNVSTKKKKDEEVHKKDLTKLSSSEAASTFCDLKKRPQDRSMGSKGKKFAGALKSSSQVSSISTAFLKEVDRPPKKKDKPALSASNTATPSNLTSLGTKRVAEREKDVDDSNGYKTPKTKRVSFAELGRYVELEEMPNVEVALSTFEHLFGAKFGDVNSKEASQRIGSATELMEHANRLEIPRSSKEASQRINRTTELAEHSTRLKSVIPGPKTLPPCSDVIFPSLEQLQRKIGLPPLLGSRMPPREPRTPPKIPPKVSPLSPVVMPRSMDKQLPSTLTTFACHPKSNKQEELVESICNLLQFDGRIQDEKLRRYEEHNDGTMCAKLLAINRKPERTDEEERMTNRRQTPKYRDLSWPDDFEVPSRKRHWAFYWPTFDPVDVVIDVVTRKDKNNEKWYNMYIQNFHSSDEHLAYKIRRMRLAEPASAGSSLKDEINSRLRAYDNHDEKPPKTNHRFTYRFGYAREFMFESLEERRLFEEIRFTLKSGKDALYEIDDYSTDRFDLVPSAWFGPTSNVTLTENNNKQHFKEWVDEYIHFKAVDTYKSLNKRTRSDALLDEALDARIGLALLPTFDRLKSISAQRILYKLRLENQDLTRTEAYYDLKLKSDQVKSAQRVQEVEEMIANRKPQRLEDLRREFSLVSFIVMNKKDFVSIYNQLTASYRAFAPMSWIMHENCGKLEQTVNDAFEKRMGIPKRRATYFQEFKSYMEREYRQARAARK
ncbi:unnamed protein product, partial [Mesorhabditis belari]|uniref:Uncharacterized protein n=1 Tax=Mesorhabditis belari TaxID=2138241 RepID=A0AAF3FQV3_9BILA